jgi:hypothetical protein
MVEHQSEQSDTRVLVVPVQLPMNQGCSILSSEIMARTARTDGGTTVN